MRQRPPSGSREEIISKVLKVKLVSTVFSAVMGFGQTGAGAADTTMKLGLPCRR
jgi:hypothetical protein